MRLAFALLLVACGGNRSHGRAADANNAADAVDAPPDAVDAPVDGVDAPVDAVVMADSSAADAPPDSGTDARSDATTSDGCPHRTAPPGVPQNPIPPGATINGSVRIVTQSDVDALAGIRYITGDLVFGSITRAIALPTVTLPDLEVVGGSVELDEANQPVGQLEEIHLPRLETVGGNCEVLRVGGAPYEITTWDAPRLESIGSDFAAVAANLDLSCVATARMVWVSTATPMDVFTFPKLRSVTGANSNIQINLPAREIDLPELVSTGELELLSMDRLTTLSAPKLVDSSIHLDGLPALSSITLGTSTHIPYVMLIDVPSLRDLDFLAGTQHLDGIEAWGLDSLHSIAGLTNTQVDSVWLVAPIDDLTPLQSSAVTGNLTISGTNATTLRLPNVVALSQPYSLLQIINNPNLTILELPNLVRINAVDYDWASQISNNPKLPTCAATAIADRVLANSPGLVFTVSGNGTGTCPLIHRRSP